jgi:Leucine-rich repeat (LRR) protein
MVNSTTQITAIVGNGATGAVTVRTTNFFSATTNAQFTFIGPPSLTSIVPSAAAVNQDIVLTGTNFFSATNASQGASLLVSVGGVTASSIVVNSPTQVTVRFASPVSGPVTLRAQGGTSVSTTMLNVYPAPTLASASPNPTGQNSFLALTGTNFVQGLTTVRLGNMVLNVTVNSPTQATVLLPANVPSGMLSITTPGGTGTLAQALTVVPPPTLTGFFPQSGSTGTRLTIAGTNLTSDGILSIGGIPTPFTLTPTGSNTFTLTALLPALPPNITSSQATISFTTIGGTTSLTQQLTLTAPEQPSITALEPNPLVEGSSLLIRLAGTNATTQLSGITIGGSVIPSTSAILQTNGTVRVLIPSGVVSMTASSTNARVSLTLTQNGRTTTTTADIALTVQAPNIPVLTGFSPQMGGAASLLTIRGQNLGTEPRGRIEAVLVGGVPVRGFRVIAPTTILVTLGTVQTGAITVLTSSGLITTSGTFTFDPRFVPYVPVSAEDSVALAALYNATNGAQWTFSRNWLTEIAATWQGVRVENGRVVELRLPANALRGVLPVQQLRALSGLRVLDLSNNRVVGDISALLQNLPLLEELRLNNTDLTGTLAGVCAAGANLRELDVSNAQCTGTLEALCCLQRIERLNMSNNQLSGQTPTCFGEKQTLTIFNASNNQLSGALPAALGNAVSLQILNLQGNRLTGSIPAAWGNIGALARTQKNSSEQTALTGLQTLNLAQNQLSGTLPAELGTLTELLPIYWTVK